jgi:hypothetical protein
VDKNRYAEVVGKGYSALRRLKLAQTTCLAVAVLAVGMFAAGLPLYYRALRTECTAEPCSVSPTPDALRAMQAAGVSLEFMAGYTVALEILTAVVHVGVAAVLVWRRPDDRMALLTGLWLLTFGTFGIHDVSKLQAVLTQVHPLWQVPVYALNILGGLLPTLFFLLFPSGRLVPTWIRWPAAVWLVWQVLQIFLSGTWVDTATWPTVPQMAYWMIYVGTLVASQLYRYRFISNARQRQQTKWVVFGFSLASVGGLAASAVTAVAPALGPGWAPLALFQDTSYYPSQLLVVLSIGVAILRSRLFDIDVIIRRTLVYSILTAVLALAYFGSVLVLESAFRAVTGQGQNSLVVVLSTLGIAALFGPVQRQVQAAIDRRFYRQKYDAAQTLARFGMSARDEVDLEQLSARLIGVVEETMQPAHVSLWLKSRAKQEVTSTQ